MAKLLEGFPHPSLWFYRTVLTSPESVKVKGRPNSNLAKDLCWYLEEFLDYPFHPNTDIAERVLDSLKEWGENCFHKLFDSGNARDWFTNARKEDLATFNLKITSNDPKILSWPWEALRDPQGTILAHSCHIERQLDGQHDPLPLPEELPQDHDSWRFKNRS